MADNLDPVARARAIAARLAAAAAPQGALGKRKSRWEDDEAGPSSSGGKKQKKVYIPVDKYPDINFMGLLIGPRGSNQKRMEDESGAKILIRGKGSSKDPTGDADEEEELHVLITGDSDESIAKAQSAVENILFNPQQAMRLKQEQLRKVAELNGTLVENYGRQDSNGGHYGPGPSSEGERSTEMKVPRELVGYIIGRGGETIRDLQTKSGAQIQIVREEPGDHQTPHRFVSISGSEEALESAQQMIQRLIDERMNGGRDFRDGDRGGSRYGGSNPDGSNTLEMLVPNERVGLIIGRAGATIKAIQQRTSASINIPQTADPNHPNMRLITINGTQAAKEAAKVEINAILNDDGSGYRAGGGGGGGSTIYMQVPNDRVGVVIGKRGETVRNIQDRCGVRIQIPQTADPGTSVRTISIQGPQDALYRAKEEIDAVILNGTGTQGSTSGYGSYYGYDQQQYGQYGYDQSQGQGQYDAYYQQYYQQGDATTAATTAAAAPGTDTTASSAASADATATTAPEATGATADPNDPNAYWNGFYEYAAYYGIDAANEAWGVTGEAAKQSAESYRQYQEQSAASAAAAPADAGAPGTGSAPQAQGPPGV
ncbi:hypothetical protein Poli38472_013614 [Pythium oligandrum]|uniref:K Homology domain-containing protein n=1 Tax=Pythium oligandrum TaxID=41045 RepID=A0A8K1CE14_PYTOL|nr:hypothetical protein Poli38472_013614 [Pythium oligandrum]|eukprot:TMW61151.1 hypothetical protein Poli38472_013614 [Pythium oligandrum]